MAAAQLENALCLPERMQADPPSPWRRGERQLGSIAELRCRRFDLRIGNVQARQTADGVTDEAPPRGQLRPGGKVLQLASAAGILDIVRTARLDAVRSRLQNLIESRASESAG